MPLLADFALSKIKDQIASASDATVVGMTSPPWAPPDQASRGSTRFDVYGLAATLLQCVTGRELLDYPDIPRALDNADVPPDVLALLRDALSADPNQRPADGQVFHLALQTIQTKRSTRWHKKKEIAFELSLAARRALEEGGDGRPAEAVIASRMGTATYAVPRLKTTDDGRTELTAEEFRLVGDQIDLKLAFKTTQKLVCIWAEVKDFEQLEFWRRHENAVTLDGRDFAWTASRPANPQQSALATHELHTLLAKAVHDAGAHRPKHKNRFTTIVAWFVTVASHSRSQMAITSQMIYARLAMQMLQNQQQEAIAAVEQAYELERSEQKAGGVRRPVESYFLADDFAATSPIVS